MKKLTHWIRTKLRVWLGIEEIFGRTARLFDETAYIRKMIRRVEDSSIIGVDLGYRELSEVIIIKYSKINNAFKVIANTESKFEYYNTFIQQLRELCKRHNAEIIAIDSMKQGIDLRSRILPDERIKSQMEDLL